MDNENKTNSSDWLDQILGTPNPPKELGVDETAVAAAGLTHPDDIELEQIIRETMSEEWKDIPLSETTTLPEVWPDADAVRLYDKEPDPQAVAGTAPKASSDTQVVLSSVTETVAQTANTEKAAPQVSAAPRSPAPAVRKVSAKQENTRPQKAAQPQKAERTQKAAQPQKAERTQKAAQPQKAERTQKAAQPAGGSGFRAWCADYWARLRKPTKPKDNLWGLTHIISSLIWLAVILAIGASVGRMGWLCAKDVLALGKTPKSLEFIIDQTDDISTVSKRLKQIGMIEYPVLFELFANITGKGDNLQVGTITFEDSIVYDYNALCNAMTYKKTTKATVEVVIPEGYSCAQIFNLLEEKGVCTARELEAYAANGELNDYWFLEGVTRGHKYCLEGFLFPDTYEFYVGDSAKRVLNKLLDDFDYRFNDRMQEKYEKLNKDLKLNLSVREVIIMASIIEKEKANHLEGYTISSVFYNRLTHAASYPFLNSDATLLYDVEYYTGKGITNEQRANSPFNTYTRKGLPIAPISNPGMGSIDAALAPETTDYYYFIFDKEAGQHLFSKTLAEHTEKAKRLGLA